MVTVSGGGITAQLDVADGARLTSLIAGGREWLAASGPRTPGRYVQQGSGGWDDVVPTVTACVLEDGTILGDHGDAWQTEWTLDSYDEAHVQTSVWLPSLPIALSKRLQATATGLLLTWTARTEAPGRFPLAWCAHPLFSADADTRIVVAEPSTLIEEYPRDRRARDWPEAVGATAIKAFTETRHSSASVIHANGDSLTLTWDERLLPYLGLYWDGGEFTSVPVVSIEPSTAFGDSTVRALDEGRVRMLEQGFPFRWWVHIQCQGDQAR